MGQPTAVKMRVTNVVPAVFGQGVNKGMVEKAGSGLLVSPELAADGDKDDEGRVRKTLLSKDWRKVAEALEILKRIGFGPVVMCRTCKGPAAQVGQPGGPGHGFICECTRVFVRG